MYLTQRGWNESADVICRRNFTRLRSIRRDACFALLYLRSLMLWFYIHLVLPEQGGYLLRPVLTGAEMSCLMVTAGCPVRAESLYLWDVESESGREFACIQAVQVAVFNLSFSWASNENSTQELLRDVGPHCRRWDHWIHRYSGAQWESEGRSRPG